MPLDQESEALWREAWARLPLPQLAEKLGDKGKLRGSDPCPFCQKKQGKFNIFQRGGRWFFKCHNGSCPAHDPEGAPDEIGYLELRRGLPRKEAALEYLRMAVPERVHTAGPIVEPERESKRADAASMESANPWHALWKRLILTDADRAKLRNKRGFDDATIDLCGFKSNNENNRDALEALLDEYPLEALIAQGIFKHERFKDPRPSGQLIGWGRTGKKGSDGKEIWDITEPILIPYFDSAGVPFYLRPHKGGVVRPIDPFAEVSDEDEDDDPEERPCSSHLYIPPGTAELVAENDGLCIFTEGEFKAAVGPQCRIPIIATPGTSFLKNARFRRAVCAALDELEVTDLVVMYDNEVKDDPRFPNFKKDPFDRYDTQVWAEYAQIMLRPHLVSAKGQCRIGWLPDTERKDGKADFDGILAHYVYREGIKKGTSQARAIFKQALRDAGEPSAFRELFPSTSRRIIEWKLKRKFHTPLLAVGSDKEMKLAEQFNKLDEGRPIDRELSGSFRDVIGCYYARKAPSKEERGHLAKLLKELNERLAEMKSSTTDVRDARLNTLFTKRDAIIQRLRGTPERLSNFTLHCDYRLHGADGNVIRLVRILDSKDLKRRNHKLVRVTKSDLCGLRNFREWLLGTGDGTWHGGEKDLQNLCEDLDHQAYMRDIHEIIRIGYDKESGIWFMGDKGFAPDGQPIYPDDKGIFWHEGFGYQLEVEADERGATGFIQDVPYFTKPHGDAALTQEALDARGGVRGIFKTFAEDMFDNIGGYDAWVALGLMLAYAIAPELLKIDGEGHPGAWFFGKLGEGKSTTMGWLMRIWGFRQLEGILLNSNLTDNALQRILSQYSCLPVFLDEARKETLTDTKLAIVRGAYQRQLPAKATADYTIKVRGVPPHTTPIVGGESSSHDGATRSRFGHVNVAASRRIGDAGPRKIRMSSQSAHYYHIGNWLLSNRPAFAKRALEMLGHWQASPKVREAISQDRVRFVHGVAYACMEAASTLLDIIEEDGQFDPSPEAQSTGLFQSRTISEFHDFLLSYGEQALRDVRDETWINKFWDDLRQTLSRGKIPKKFFMTFHLTRKEGGYKYARGGPYDAKDGQIPALLISIKDVFPAYEEAYRLRTGQTPPLSMNDIRRSLEREPYWIPPQEKGRSCSFHRPKDMNNERGSFWAISLEETTPSTAEADDDPCFLFPFAEEYLSAMTTKDDQS